ncbi:MAG: aminoglycoside phosphotransferase family protein [Prevotellaceae bacterium]|nr:aminoglycoside phosphotransferase family protein [Prevotellaceae bacterium]
MDIKNINLADYIQSGAGANGASYDCIADNTIMLKLYNTDYPTDTISHELDVARKVYEIGVPSPKPGELVTDGERIGIRFKRIVGKRSFSRMVADEPERYDEFTREFARCCLKLHSIKCPEGMFPDAKPQFQALLDADVYLNAEQKAKASAFLKNIPDTMTALHGDMHIGNVISTLPLGAPLSHPHDLYFIDLGYFAHGYPLLDLGMMRCMCITADEEFRSKELHIDGALAAKVWETFIDEYFHGKFTVEEADALILPYQALKCFLIEYNINGFLPPHYEELVKNVDWDSYI